MAELTSAGSIADELFKIAIRSSNRSCLQIAGLDWLGLL